MPSFPLPKEPNRAFIDAFESRLRILQEKTGLSEGEVGKRCGLSRGYISQLLRHGTPQAWNLMSIVNFFNGSGVEGARWDMNEAMGLIGQVPLSLQRHRPSVIIDEPVPPTVGHMVYVYDGDKAATHGLNVMSIDPTVHFTITDTMFAMNNLYKANDPRTIAIADKAEPYRADNMVLARDGDHTIYCVAKQATQKHLTILGVVLWFCDQIGTFIDSPMFLPPDDTLG